MGLRLGLETHLVTSHYLLPLVIDRPGGLLVEVTDGTTEYNAAHYRISVFYDLVKVAVNRLAFSQGHELNAHGAAAVAITPGWLRSEMMLEAFGVTEDNWQKAIKKDPNYAESETPSYLGRGIVALATDPEIMQKSGKVFSSWRLAEEYGFTDLDGRKPNWGRHFRETEDERVIRVRELMLQSHEDFIESCSKGLSRGK